MVKVMVEKFSLNDLFMRIMPGGTCLGAIVLICHYNFNIQLIKELEFIYVFMFFTFSYVIGEILQTISHEIEHFTMIFFKFYLPSEIFLYKNNPILKENIKLQKIIDLVDLTDQEKEIIKEIDYKKLPLFSERNNFTEAKNINQRCFLQLYHDVHDKVTDFNRGYLFARCMTCMFLFVSVILLFCKCYEFGVIIFAVFLLFMWRLRGMARTLVFKVIQNSLY